MFSTLPESRAPHTRRVGGTAASLVVHGVLIAGAVSLTMTGTSGATGVASRPKADTIIFIPAPRRPPIVAVPRTRTDAPPRGPVFRPPTHVYVDVVPPAIPPVDVTGPTIAPEDVVIGRGGHVGVATTGSASSGDPGALGGGGTVVGEAETDRAPHLVGAAPQPRYPDALRAAGIAGHVVLQFVVDTLGRAEPGSLDVREATHPDFVSAVRAALPRYRFTPGEVAGRKVRTRVQIPFEFSLR